jgi:predicted permease
LLVVAQPVRLSYIEFARLDGVVILWGVGLTLATGILFGLAPAAFVAGQRAAESLKAGARSAAGNRAARRFRGGLVVAEIALSVVLLVASGLLVRTMSAMVNANIGMQPHGLWGVTINLGAKQIGDSIARVGTLNAVVERVRSLPGVEGVVRAVTVPPHFGIGMAKLEIEGHSISDSDSLKSIRFASADPALLRLAGIRILEGRVYDPDPTPSDLMRARTGVVVNATFARRFWPSGGAVGARIRRGEMPWTTIVGVAEDVRVPSPRASAIDETQFYDAMPAAPKRVSLVIRSIPTMAMLLPSVEAAIRAVNPLIKIGKAESADMYVANERAMHRATLLLIGSFAGLALLLAAFGLHAVIAYGVSQRTREIGVRVALGAQAQDVIGLVVGQGIRLAVVGVVLGGVGGVLAARAMRALLYQVAPSDPVTLIGVGGLLAVVAIVASYAPARRAAGVDPVEALRAE